MTNQVLTIPAEQAGQVEPANGLYETALRPVNPVYKFAKWLYTVVGLCAFIWLSYNEPWSASLPRPLRLLVLAFRGVLFVEAFGYAYHRFFQHLGFLTRRAFVFRRNQRFHWMHHMILYPIGRHYRRPGEYVSSEGGLGISWLAPAVLVVGFAFYKMGLTPESFVFVGGMISYAYFFVDDIHARFHLEKHSYQGNRYYKWLEDIHILHHWDQSQNFTICHPFMDWFFGTYLAPRKNRKELAVATADNELTISDLVNWRYLLLEASPAEYAAFISEAKRHPRSIRKIGHLLEVLRSRLEVHPSDVQALILRRRAVELLELVRPGIVVE